MAAVAYLIYILHSGEICFGGLALALSCSIRYTM